MEFTCDPAKNPTNIETRGLPLLAAQAMFNTAMVVVEDARKPIQSGGLSVITPWRDA